MEPTRDNPPLTRNGHPSKHLEQHHDIDHQLHLFITTFPHSQADAPTSSSFGEEEACAVVAFLFFLYSFKVIAFLYSLLLLCHSALPFLASF